ncbi:assembly factor cbp4 [Aspergillus terreus]|uniref:Cytochrome b mRNA-processing protein 4 n=1 Tax=Aspergillus terreus TaxID=33178 RepID=A0A5M3Z336_ASPTE|nr:hypothetical protein ATETN484_0008038100 [Aspergillus terreus]GFF21209.1 assembly factor cbp4 [Aspergillus terreus]
MSRAGTWLKMLGAGIVICVGGPAFVQSIRPTDEELFKRYNPELQRRSLEEGDRRAQEFDDYVNRLKQWSKSDKSIWYAAQEQQEQKRSEAEALRNQAKDEARAQREEMRKELLVTETRRQDIETAVRRSFNKWVVVLAGFDGFPYTSVDVNIIGWAVRDHSLFQGSTEGVDVCTTT